MLSEIISEGELVAEKSGESLDNTKTKTSQKKGKKCHLLTKFQEKAFDFSFLEHESEDINSSEETCIALIHGYNEIPQKHDDTLNCISREHHKSYNGEGKKLVS